MEDFTLYLELGLRHIANLNALDHILFLLALVSVFQFADLKKVVLLVTAFTIGHSVTLALATFDILRIEDVWVEFLIPVTILITATFNLVKGKAVSKQRMVLPFVMASFFGFIHGLGFSNYLNTLLSNEESLFWPLFGFNIGIELGQIAIVLIILILAQLMFQVLRFKHRDWILVISGVCIGGALILMKQSIFW